MENNKLQLRGNPRFFILSIGAANFSPPASMEWIFIVTGEHKASGSAVVAVAMTLFRGKKRKRGQILRSIFNFGKGDAIWEKPIIISKIHLG